MPHVSRQSARWRALRLGCRAVESRHPGSTGTKPDLREDCAGVAPCEVFPPIKRFGRAARRLRTNASHARRPPAARASAACAAALRVQAAREARALSTAQRYQRVGSSLHPARPRPGPPPHGATQRRLSEASALAQTTDSAASLRRLRRREHPRATSNGLVAARAVPDADGLPLDLVLAAEGAAVLCVLRDLHLLHDFPKGRTIARAVLAGDAHLLRALVHLRGAARRAGEGRARQHAPRPRPRVARSERRQRAIARP